MVFWYFCNEITNFGLPMPNSILFQTKRWCRFALNAVRLANLKRIFIHYFMIFGIFIILNKNVHNSFFWRIKFLNCVYHPSIVYSIIETVCQLLAKQFFLYISSLFLVQIHFFYCNCTFYQYKTKCQDE